METKKLIRCQLCGRRRWVRRYGKWCSERCRKRAERMVQARRVARLLKLTAGPRRYLVLQVPKGEVVKS